MDSTLGTPLGTDYYIDIEEATGIAGSIGAKLPHINAIYRGEWRHVEGINEESSNTIQSIKNVLSSARTENALYVVNYKNGGFP